MTARTAATATTAAPATVTAARTEERRTNLAFGAAAVLAFGLLVWLGRGLTFFADEWEVIAHRPIGLDTFLRPFNEHWLGITTLVHRALVEAIGLTTYLPYHALLVVLHLVVATEVYLLARRATLPLLALAIGVVVLVFGSGFENLFWAMQIGFVGAAALGFGAVLLLDGVPTRRHVAAATGLLLAGVMTSGFGLFMLAFAVLDVLVDPRRRRHVVPLLVPGIVWLGWYVAFGRSGVATHGDPFTAGRLVEVPGFIVRGGGVAFGSALGIGPQIGIAALVGAAGWTVLRLARPGPAPEARRPPYRAAGAIGAIVAMYGLLGLVRSGLEEVDASLYTRYAYLSGIFALLALASLVGQPTLPGDRRARALAVAAGGLVVTLSLGWNMLLLVQGRALFAERAELTRALVSLGLSEDLPAGVDPNLTLVLVPSPTDLRAVVAAHGSPLTDALAPDAVPPISAEAAEEALRRALDPPDYLFTQAGG